jgi:protoporphyrinogen oxidase
MGDVDEMMKDTAVYSFQEGIETLPKALAKELQNRQNVDIRLGLGVNALRKTKDGFDVSAVSVLAECVAHFAPSYPRLPQIRYLLLT